MIGMLSPLMPRRRALRRRLAVALLPLGFLAAGARLAAQEPIRPRYGLFGGYAINRHDADFLALPGVPSCSPGFTDGSGGGPILGALYELPLSERLLLGLRAGYAGHDATLTAREPVYLIVDGTGRPGAIEHRLRGTLGTIGLEPSIQARPFGGVLGGFFVALGARAGAYIARRYDQAEQIVDPVDAGTFLDAAGNDSRSRVRNQSSGDIPGGSSLLLEGTIGLGIDLPMNARGTVLLAPEISYAYAFTDVASGVNWKPNGARATIAVKYSPAPEPPKPTGRDTVFLRDTTSRSSASIATATLTLQHRAETHETIELPDSIIERTTIRESYLRELPVPPPPVCSIAVSGVDADGNEEPMATLRIEEFMSTVAHPLLNYVFFEPGSSTIPDRYTRLAAAQADTFRIESLFGAGTMEVYHTMLNVIGQRLRKYPRAMLTLTGCNMDAREEKGNLDLSRSRADEVRRYLTGVWGIDEGRIRIEATNLPAKRSNPLTPDGQAEDRRVEISSDTPEILDVLLSGDTARTSAPPTVRLRPSLSAAQGAGAWRVRIMQHGALLKELSGTGAPPAALDWDPLADRANPPRFDDSISIEMEATDAAGQPTRCGAMLATRVVTLREKRQQQVGDFSIDRYNLILFNVGEAGITPTNQRIIDMVSSRLRPTSELTVEGFADRTGSAESNQRLSAQRASATAQALARPEATTRGVGEARLLYPNDTPEGRFYCRTVQITVKTPLPR